MRSQGHRKEIMAEDWTPAGAPSTYLATASNDGTVRVWDGWTGACASVLSGHREPVYGVAFSPCGRHVATGGFDGQVLVWSARGGAQERAYKAGTRVYQVAWHSSGNFLAASTADGSVHVLDMRA